MEIKKTQITKENEINSHSHRVPILKNHSYLFLYGSAFRV